MGLNEVLYNDSPWASSRLYNRTVRHYNGEADNPVLHGAVSDSVGSATVCTYHSPNLRLYAISPIGVEGEWGHRAPIEGLTEGPGSIGKNSPLD